MINHREIFKLLPDKIINYINTLEDMDKIQELRIRLNRPVIIQTDKSEYVTAFKAKREDISAVIQKISSYSIYAFEEDIKQGFITFKGGHRIGICGECIIEDNKIKTIKNISSLNIRIGKEFIGCSDFLIPFLKKDNRVLNTVIISPPKCGKTTLLRDITRNISNGNIKKGRKVSLMDERSEIAGCCMGIPGMDIGIRTDIYDGCIKSEGIMMAIRSMSPEVIICDEIGTVKDSESIIMAYNCGVDLICSIHGESLKDFTERLVFKELINNNIFHIAVMLLNREKPGKISEIYDLKADKTLWRNDYD